MRLRDPVEAFELLLVAHAQLLTLVAGGVGVQHLGVVVAPGAESGPEQHEGQGHLPPLGKPPAGDAHPPLGTGLPAADPEQEGHEQQDAPEGPPVGLEECEALHIRAEAAEVRVAQTAVAVHAHQPAFDVQRGPREGVQHHDQDEHEVAEVLVVHQGVHADGQHAQEAKPEDARHDQVPEVDLGPQHGIAVGQLSERARGSGQQEHDRKQGQHARHLRQDAQPRG